MFPFLIHNYYANTPLGILTCGLNNALDMMKNLAYSVVPIHERPDLYEECCRIINAEWPASETRRLRTFRESCEQFPTCLVLLKGNNVVGHCKLSLIPMEYKSCFLGSVVIDHAWRSQGLGSMLLRGAEEYAAKRCIQRMYLTTKGQEGFYLKNGYVVCPPVNIWDSMIVSSSPETSKPRNDNFDKRQSFGPPPPPMPMPVVKPSNSPLTSSKTFMIKYL